MVIPSKPRVPRWLERRRQRLKPVPTTPPIPTYERWNKSQRWQHIVLAVSFLLLIITGWPLRFAHLPASKYVMWIFGGVKGAGIIHRAAAVGLIGVSIYHVFYLFRQFLNGHRQVTMFPTLKDIRDFFTDLLYWLGLSGRRARYGRYNYLEKFEYFAVVWGNVVMILSGLVLWFPVFSSTYLFDWVNDLALLIHDYEAWLAGLAIFLWHFYWVHLNPRVFPMDPTWLTGAIELEHLKHERPLEYETLKKQGKITDET